ncbi:hypothetical protein RND81_03G088000 [Saponaria officinalis]|uniref:CCHC-type domain-containing protein n=1 Tax=Saponaria officinalis TaxID=3572 RepID=A0AAW1M616_SAPOF
MGELEENEEQKMSRFLRGLNRGIANFVKLYPYTDFDTLCGLCLKIEAQGKSRYGASNVDNSRFKAWVEPDFSSKVGASSSSSVTVPKPVSTLAPNPSPKTTSVPRETSLSKVRCFKCQGFGHYQNACPNKRVVTLRETISVQDELLDEKEKERLGDIFNFDECEDGEEEVESYDAPNYDTNLVLRTLQAKTVSSDSEQRGQIFLTKCHVKDKWCSLIIDGGICTNAASSEMVTKLGLTTTAHPSPYELYWLEDGRKVRVSKQVRVGLTMGSYNDEILCDVIPMDACHVLLGRPWQFDRDVIHHGRTNEYELRDKGKRIVLKSMSSQAIREMSTSRGKKPNLSAFSSKREIEHDVIGVRADLNKSPCAKVRPKVATDTDREVLPKFPQGNNGVKDCEVKECTSEAPRVENSPKKQEGMATKSTNIATDKLEMSPGKSKDKNSSSPEKQASGAAAAENLKIKNTPQKPSDVTIDKEVCGSPITVETPVSPTGTNSKSSNSGKKSQPSTPHIARKLLDEEDNWSMTSSASARTTRTRTTVPVAPTFTISDRSEKRKEYYSKLEEKRKALEAEKREYEARTKEEEEALIFSALLLIILLNEFDSYYLEVLRHILCRQIIDYSQMSACFFR